MRKVRTYEDMYSIFGEGKEVSEEDFLVDLCVPEIELDDRIVFIDVKSFSTQIANYFVGEFLSRLNPQLEKEYCKRVSKCILRSITEYFNSGPIKKEVFGKDTSGEILRSYNELIEFFSDKNRWNSHKWELIGYDAYSIIEKFTTRINLYQEYIVSSETCSEEISSLFLNVLEISTEICSIIEKNKWISKLAEDIPEFGKELRRG